VEWSPAYEQIKMYLHRNARLQKYTLYLNQQKKIAEKFGENEKIKRKNRTAKRFGEYFLK